MTSKNDNSYENLDTASLKYLAGVRKTIEECGIMTASPTTGRPHSPATINVTADSGPELTGMLRDIMGLAGVHKVEPHHMPVISTPPGPSAVAAPADGPSMKDLVGMFREEEPEVVQDSMNDKNRPYDSSPHEQEHEGNWPLDGDQDNNLVANKDAMVDRNRMADAQSNPAPTAEGLFIEYKKFISESKKEKSKKEKCNHSAKGKKCPVHGMKEDQTDEALDLKTLRDLASKEGSCKETGKKECPVHNGKEPAKKPPATKTADKNKPATNGKSVVGKSSKMDLNALRDRSKGK